MVMVIGVRVRMGSAVVRATRSARATIRLSAEPHLVVNKASTTTTATVRVVVEAAPWVVLVLVAVGVLVVVVIAVAVVTVAATAVLAAAIVGIIVLRRTAVAARAGWRVALVGAWVVARRTRRRRRDSSSSLRGAVGRWRWWLVPSAAHWSWRSGTRAVLRTAILKADTDRRSHHMRLWSATTARIMMVSSSTTTPAAVMPTVTSSILSAILRATIGLLVLMAAIRWLLRRSRTTRRSV